MYSEWIEWKTIEPGDDIVTLEKKLAENTNAFSDIRDEYNEVQGNRRRWRDTRRGKVLRRNYGIY